MSGQHGPGSGAAAAWGELARPSAAVGCACACACASGGAAARHSSMVRFLGERAQGDETMDEGGETEGGETEGGETEEETEDELEAWGGGEHEMVSGLPRPPVGSVSSTHIAKRLAAGGLGPGLAVGLIATPLGLRSRGLAGERRSGDLTTGGLSSRGLEAASEPAAGEERRGSDAKTGLGGGEPLRLLRAFRGESALLGLIGGLEALAAAASAEEGGSRSGHGGKPPPSASSAEAVHRSRCISPVASCCVSGRANHVA